MTSLQIGRTVLAPYAECRSNHDVVCGLAKQFGVCHPGFAMTAPALVNAEALTRLGIADGDRVCIGNGKGSVVVHARALGGMQCGVVVEALWPNSALEEGIGVSELTSTGLGLPGGDAAFHDTSVCPRPA